MYNQGLGRATWKHGLGIINQNGERLIELFLVSDLALTSALFPRKDICKHGIHQRAKQKKKYGSIISASAQNTDHVSKTQGHIELQMLSVTKIFAWR